MDAHRIEAIRKKLDQAGMSTEGLSDEDLSQLVGGSRGVECRRARRERVR